MKLIIFIVIIVLCHLFDSSKGEAGYAPEPDKKSALTKPLLEGRYWKMWVPPYGAPYWECYTNEEVAVWREENPNGYTGLNEEMGTCQKCSNNLWV